MKALKTGLIAGALSLFAATSHATLVDFTDGSVWGTGSQASPKSVGYGDITVTLTAFSDHPTTTDYTNKLEGGCNIAPLTCQTDGIGIRDDEVTWHSGGMYDGELISIDFSRAVDIAWIGFLDLFMESGGAETAQVVATYEGGAKQGQGFTADQEVGTKGWFQATDYNGIKSVTDFLYGVTRLEFFADRAGSISGPSNSDFALAAIDIIDYSSDEPVGVSEPGSLALLGLGILGLVGARRRMA